MQLMFFDVIGPNLYLFTIKRAKYTTIHHRRATSLRAQLSRKFGNLIIGGGGGAIIGGCQFRHQRIIPAQLFGTVEYKIINFLVIFIYSI